jgi:hypothetical protein
MAILKQIRKSIATILVIATLMISSVATLNLQQASAFGFVERQQIGEFQKLTALFEKAAIGAQNPPEPEKTAQFRQSIGQFKADIINAVLDNRLGLIPGILDRWNNPITGKALPGNMNWEDYFDEVSRIFCKPCV